MSQSSRNNNYDHVAPVYDMLSRLIFGKAIIDAQKVLLSSLKPGSRILIAGGGSGWVLETLAALVDMPFHIVYVELSAKMIRMAEKRNSGGHRVIFINSAIEAFKDENCFDAVITAFLFDNFKKEKAGAVFNHIDTMICRGGLWLFTDFFTMQKTLCRHKVILKIMYLFFKITSRVEASVLTDIHPFFKRMHYQCEKEYFFCRGFIKSAVYSKQAQC